MKPRIVTALRLSDEFSPSRRALEADAEEGERQWNEGRYSLAKALPPIRRVRELFTSHKRNSIDFRGCRSWGEYCRERLHCTPQAVTMAERRLRLSEAEKEIERERRRERKWTQQAEKNLHDTEFGRARNGRWVQQMAKGQHEYEQAVEAGIVEDAVEAALDDHLNFSGTDEIIKAFLALSDEDVAIFDQIIAAAASLAPHLVEAIKALRARHMVLARDVRKDLDIRVGGGNVLEMPARR
jgi:hypothetical protein